jgi:dephospho-CoA kinase
MIKLVIYGQSGSGKSTSARIMRNYFEQCGYRVTILKLAQPLYTLQQQFYHIAGQTIDFYSQDQILLEMIAAQLRRISPMSLVNDFLHRLSTIDADVVINDDLRDPYVDYPVLEQHGFRFIRITCQETLRVERLGQRKDLSSVAHSTSTSDIGSIKPHILVDNSGNLEKLQTTIQCFLDTLRASL